MPADAGADAGVDAGAVTANVGEYGACTSQAPVSPSPDLSGTWAVRTISSRFVPATGLTAEYYMRTVSVLLSNQVQTGTNLTFDLQFCNQYAEQDATAPAQLTVPESYVRALKPFERTGTYAAGDAGVNVLWLPMYPEVVGAALADPANGPLPTDPSDPAVYDQDQDGNPGITVKVSGIVSGDLYVVQRQKDELKGIAISNDRVVGSYSFTSEQNILATNPTALKLLATQTALTDSRECASTFVMVRLAAGATCADVLATGTVFD
jgi:hypothetical protein